MYTAENQREMLEKARVCRILLRKERQKKLRNFKRIFFLTKENWRKMAGDMIKTAVPQWF